MKWYDMKFWSLFYGGACHDSAGKYTCECATSFSGDKCEKTPDYRSVKNCLGNMCYNSMLEIGGICECTHSYTYYRSSGMSFYFLLGEKCTYLLIKHFFNQIILLFFLFVVKTYIVDTLEKHLSDASNDYPQHVFVEK